MEQRIGTDRANAQGGKEEGDVKNRPVFEHGNKRWGRWGRMDRLVNDVYTLPIDS